MACGILVPQPGIKPMSPTLEVLSPNHLDHQESLKKNFYVQIFLIWHKI